MEQLPVLMTAPGDPRPPPHGPQSSAQDAEIEGSEGFITAFLTAAVAGGEPVLPAGQATPAGPVTGGSEGDGLPPARPALAAPWPATVAALQPSAPAPDGGGADRPVPDARAPAPSGQAGWSEARAGQPFALRSAVRAIVTPPPGPGGSTDDDGAGETRAGGLRLAAACHATADPASVSTHIDLLSRPNGLPGKLPALPVDQPAVFAERLTQGVSVMLTHHAHHARIAVTPPELGPVEVRVKVTGEEASVQLISAHPATREALEDALPRLRILFADGGLSLGEAGVFAQTPGRGDTWTAAGDDQVPLGAVDVPGAVDGVARIGLKLGLIDQFV